MITIVPYNPGWPDAFVEIAQPMRTALGALALRIDHIGSTSVPGLAAKDRIDIQITVQQLDCIPQMERALEPLGYILKPENTSDHRPPLAQGPETDWEKRFFRAAESQRPTNVHIRVAGRPNQRYPILFRDYLRLHPQASAAYAQIKVMLAQRQPDDLEFYYDIKDPVCDVIMGAAEEWAHLTDWQMGPADR